MAIVNGEIRCSRCKVSKPLADYQPSIVNKGCGTCRSCKYTEKMARYAANPGKEAERARTRRAARRDELNANARRWLAEDRDRAKAYGLAKYGITLDQYNLMLDEQGGGCAICGAISNKNGKALFVDHCHATGKVRGILCHRCNTGLGSFKDNATLVAKAAIYLSGSN